MTRPPNLTEQDQRFADRLRLRDDSAIPEIRRAYERHLRRLLRRNIGPLISETDVDEITGWAFSQIWEHFDPDGGRTVRSFLFMVAKRRLISTLRTARTRRKHLRQYAAEVRHLNPHQEASSELPSPSLSDQNDPRIQQHLDAAVVSLPERQRLAVLRRFAPGEGDAWAKALAEEMGKTASYWRKASDDGVKNIRKFFKRHGVVLEMEGGQYEVA